MRPYKADPRDRSPPLGVSEAPSPPDAQAFDATGASDCATLMSNQFLGFHASWRFQGLSADKSLSQANSPDSVVLRLSPQTSLTPSVSEIGIGRRL